MEQFHTKEVAHDDVSFYYFLNYVTTKKNVDGFMTKLNHNRYNCIETLGMNHEY